MSSSPSIPAERDVTGIPVACSKCNQIFESEGDYVVHYNELHAATSLELASPKSDKILGPD